MPPGSAHDSWIEGSSAFWACCVRTPILWSSPSSCLSLQQPSPSFGIQNLQFIRLLQSWQWEFRAAATHSVLSGSRSPREEHLPSSLLFYLLVK